MLSRCLLWCLPQMDERLFVRLGCWLSTAGWLEARPGYSLWMLIEEPLLSLEWWLGAVLLIESRPDHLL